jgi:peptidoglycan/LPS O-acetylase OafA/YrhL
MVAAFARTVGSPGQADAAPDKRAPFHIPSLDGLRAVSFLIVFAAHAGVPAFPGGFGVTVFFFLSGYLITTLMRMEADSTGHVSLKHFYLRRALRILPPFYIVLLAASALAAIGVVPTSRPLQAAAVGSQILHFSNYWIAAHGWGGIAPGTGVYWSLAVEEHFYLVFPAVFLALQRAGITGRRAAGVFWCGCALVLAWRCVLVFVLHAATDRTNLCSDTRIDSIAYGCALAVWNNPMLDRSGGEAHPALWKFGVLPAAVAVLLVTFVVRSSTFRETIRYSLQGVALTPIFIASVRSPRWLVFRPLQLPAVRFVGTLSYSLYLMHQVVLTVARGPLGLTGVVRAFVALVLSLGIAWAMYEVIEKPCARLRRRLSAAGAT